MRHRVLPQSSYVYEAVLARTRAAFAEMYGEAAAGLRQMEINNLPAVEWKGRTLRTLYCAAPFGRPHDLNVPEFVLWSLLDLRLFVCPWHR
jgi:hypothetical protein